MAAGHREHRVDNLQIDGVERDLGGGIDHLQVDCQIAAEAGGADLGCDRELVVQRLDVGGRASGGRRRRQGQQQAADRAGAPAPHRVVPFRPVQCEPDGA